MKYFGKYIGLLRPKQENPAPKGVLTEKGARLMALGASGLQRRTNHLRDILEAATRRRRITSTYSA